MITHLGRWICPALFGPLFGAWGILLWLGCTHDRDAWIAGLLVATLLGGLQGILLLLVDALLLRLRLRLLPMGARAWLMGLGAPLLTLAAWIALWPRHRLEPPAALVFLPLGGSALCLRFLFSPRFGRAS